MPQINFDFARCRGTDYPECLYCLRRTTPPDPYWQSYISPPNKQPCEYLLKDGAHESVLSNSQIYSRSK